MVPAIPQSETLLLAKNSHEGLKTISNAIAIGKTVRN
jgi:hypothetical protein